MLWNYVRKSASSELDLQKENNSGNSLRETWKRNHSESQTMLYDLNKGLWEGFT